MPTADQAHTTPKSVSSRRAVLRDLATCSVAGGISAVLNAPLATAQPIQSQILADYNHWLFFERRLLLTELFSDPAQREIQEAIYPRGSLLAQQFHFPPHPMRWDALPQPSSRAATVLNAIGCKWQS